MYFDNFLCVCLLNMSSFMLPIQYLCLLQRIRGHPALSPLLQLFPPASPPSLSAPSSASFDFMNCDIYEHSDYDYDYSEIMISTMLRQPGPFKLNDCEGDGWRQGWLDWEQVSRGFLGSGLSVGNINWHLDLS